MPRLGLYLGRLPGFDKRGFDLRDVVECVRAADQCGYDSFWMPEAWEREAFAVLANLASATTRIGLGTGIVNVFSRTPAVIAMGAATLDEMSAGRFRLGLGTSGARVVEDFHGLKFDKPLTRLRETVLIVRRLLSGDAVDFDGEVFTLKRFRLGFKPVREGVPIYLASLSPASVRMTGEIADGWLPTLWPRAHLADGVGWLREGAARAARDVATVAVAPFINVVVGDDAAKARDAARLPIAYYVGGMGRYYHASVSRLGLADEATAIQSLWQSGRRKAAIAAVSDAMVDALAICGPVQACRDRLDEARGSGATIPLIPIPAEGTTLEKCRTIELLLR